MRPGGADPCRMAMVSWNWGAVANKKFIAAKPIVKALIENVNFPLEEWSYWEFNINKNGGSNALITKMADERVSSRKTTFDSCVLSFVTDRRIRLLIKEKLSATREQRFEAQLLAAA